MNVLVVLAHPLQSSLCRHLSEVAIQTLEQQGHCVRVEDLYEAGFAPALTEIERSGYYATPAAQASAETERLLWAEAIVLVFPTWWFGFPAILKGWFDRAWAPGHAYDHASDLGAIQPRLQHLKHLLAITSLGSASWVDRFVMHRPVRRVLKTALLGTCAPACRFNMLSIYKSERLSVEQIDHFADRVQAVLRKWS